MKITVGQITDRGLNPKRVSNEDNLLALPDRGVYLVADGVGGRLGGEVASQTVVDVFSIVFAQSHHEDLRKVIESAIEFCNQKIYEDALSNPELDGMATTIAMLAIEGKRAIIAHVGDSRVYRFDRKGLICLTEDHSEVGDALRAGLITAEQAAQHPRRNVISRALGAEPEVEPDFREIEIDDQSSFLLCSDGINRHITDQEIARLMKSGQRPQTICERMKNLCYQGGAEDNLTAIVIDFGPRRYAEEPTRPRIPAKVAQAQAAPAPPRQANRIEVNLKPSAPASGKRGSGQGNDQTPRQKVPANSQPARQSGSLAISQAGPQAEAHPGAENFKESKFRAGKEQGGEMLLKGEMSKFMKMSLLFIAMVFGAVIGVLLYAFTPLSGIVGNLIGNADPYEKRQIQYRPNDPEINAAFARHLEGHSDDARTRINAVLTANPANAEALYYLGRIDLDQKKFEDAVNHLNQAAKQDGKLPDVWAHLATAYLGLGQTRNALDALRNLSTPSSSGAPQMSPTPAG
ncbi:MAG: tetratricopeptide repeat protein [Blastocatellales bacterium]